MFRKQEKEYRVDDTNATRRETNCVNSERKFKVREPLPQQQMHLRMET
jgi:hypothetical protein